MNEALVHGLELVRSACAQLRAHTERADQAATLDSIRRMLGEMIARESVLPAIEIAVAQRLLAVLGEPGRAAADYGEAAATVRAYVRALPAAASAEARRRLDVLATVEHAFARVADRAVSAELGRNEIESKPEDQPVADVGALRRFLAGTQPGEQGVEIIEVRQVARGMSKRTVLVKLRGNRTLPDVVALRIDRKAEDNYLGTTVIDEYPVLRHLWKHGAPIPQPHALEPTGTVLGDPFIVFSAVGGAPVGGNYTAPPRNPALMADIAARLAQIHAVPTAGFPAGPAAAASSESEHHIDREIERCLGDWRALDVANPAMELAFRWVREHQRHGRGPPCVVHNDYNFNNILVEDGHVSAVLDWEFVHVGTAAADIGYLYYSAEQVSSFEHFLAAYAGAGGAVPPAEQLKFYVFWGQLRLAVMAFQGARHLDEGRFHDIRFAITRQHRRAALLRVTDQLAAVGWFDPSLARELEQEFAGTIPG